MTLPTDSGIKDVNSIAGQPDTKFKISQAAQEVAMLLALQKKEWQELRSVDGVILRLINLQEPINKRKILLIAIGTNADDIIGDDATLNIFINGLGIDAIVERVVQKHTEEKKVAEKEKA